MNPKFKLVDKRTEIRSDGDYNVITLWDAGDKIEIFDIMEWCSKIDKESYGLFFHFDVFFDSTENAVFPKYPITAEYGLEPEVRKHIKAIYCYCKKNNYSMLKAYNQNSLDGKPTLIPI